MSRYWMLLVLWLWPWWAVANEVEVVDVLLRQGKDGWNVSVTLRHGDTGWGHFADIWRLVDENGKEFSRRVLAHPHEDEQPFARSLSHVHLPEGVSVFYVEAHDTVHGWSPQRLRIDMAQPTGERYRVVK